MVRILRLLVGLVALIIIVAFAVANRQPVDISFAPFPISLELPLYGAFLFGLVVGVLVGGIGVGLSGLAKRREARRLRGKVWALENQIKVLKQQEERERAERYSATRGTALQAAGD
jgi:uncharacterized integral membrane protein